jgi:hypothetical protein
MDQQAKVREIEERARRAYSSVRAVCRRANVTPSTFARWKRTDGNPEPTSMTLSTLQRIERALCEIEAEARNARRDGKAVAA